MAVRVRGWAPDAGSGVGAVGGLAVAGAPAVDPGKASPSSPLSSKNATPRSGGPATRRPSSGRPASGTGSSADGLADRAFDLRLLGSRSYEFVDVQSSYLYSPLEVTTRNQAKQQIILLQVS